MNWNKRTILQLIWLTLLVMMTFSTSMAQSGGLLFKDDFENGARSEWSFWQVQHEVIEVDGNHVLHLKSDSKEWANIEIITGNESNWRWTDYALEARVKILSVDKSSPTPQFFVNLRSSPDGRNSYSGWLRFQQSSSGGGLGGSLKGAFRGISGVEQAVASPQLNTWHTVRLEANANEIIWSLDGKTIVRAIDDEVTKGGANFGLSPDVEIYLDDVKIYKLEPQEALIDTRYDNDDCTIPDPGNPSSFTFDMPAGVNVRSLAADDFALVKALPQTANVGVVGWFDAAGTPFQSIAGGTWLILYDGTYAVKASLVSIADAALTDVPRYDYVDGAFVPPETGDSEADTSDRFEVTYADFCRGSLAWTTQTVQINTETMMPVPFGLVEKGDYESIDATLDVLDDATTGAVSGILVRIWEAAVQEGRWNLIVAFPTDNGDWKTVMVTGIRRFMLRPVDSDLVSTDPPNEFFNFEASTRIYTNYVVAGRTLRPGDHVVLFFGEYTTNADGVPNTQFGCNDIATTSQAIAALIDGETCEIVNQPGQNGWISTYLRGFMYLND